MTERKKTLHDRHAAGAAPDDGSLDPAATDAPQGPGSPEAPAAGVSGVPAEPAEEAVRRLEAELDEVKDRHLRLAAEFDNFRKRTARERLELEPRVRAELLARLIDALDDLARFAHVDPADTDARALHEGVDMVERKFWKELEAVGLRRIDQAGVPFDPAIHEAVSAQPAPAPEADQRVASVLQAGYLLGNALLRPARVVVSTWSGDR